MIYKIELTTTKPELTDLYLAMLRLKYGDADIRIDAGDSDQFTPYSSSNVTEEIDAMMDWKVIRQYADQFWAYVKEDE